MLSENLQHRISGDKAPQPCIPHGSQVLAVGFIQGDGKPSLIQPLGLTIGGQAGSEGLCVFDAARLDEK